MSLITLVVAFPACLGAARAAPCTCIPAPPLATRAPAQQALAVEGAAVFEGRVVAIRHAPDSTLAEGGRYLVFAHALDQAAAARGAGAAPRASSGRTVTATTCGPTRAWDRESRRLARLLGRPRREAR